MIHRTRFDRVLPRILTPKIICIVKIILILYLYDNPYEGIEDFSKHMKI